MKNGLYVQSVRSMDPFDLSRVWGEVQVRTYGEDDDIMPLQYDGHCTTTIMIST